MSLTTRFAPSPTGPLHLGHAYSAWMAYDLARAHGGRFLLRIEDIDQGRSREHWETAIREDLHWLGIDWIEVPVRQSERRHLYRNALQKLWEMKLLFSCNCTRSDVINALSAPQEGALPVGPDGFIYPGTCRSTSRTGNLPPGVLRLDMKAASYCVGALRFCALSDRETREIVVSADDLIDRVGDVVLSRSGIGTSYHLSVVVDDAAQAVSHVVRGRDLEAATPIHVLLQHLLGLPTPLYLHHPLIRDAEGRRLAKRHDARAIREYRASGATPSDLRRMVGLDQTPGTGSSTPFSTLT